MSTFQAEHDLVIYIYLTVILEDLSYISRRMSLPIKWQSHTHVESKMREKSG